MSDGGLNDLPTAPGKPVEWIGSYRVLAELGRGGMGSVYLAQDPTLDRKVVVKVLHPYLASDPVFIQRLIQEANAAASVNHPSIVRIFKVEAQAAAPFIVMEYFAGEPLSERVVRRGPLDLEFGLGVARNITLGLREAARAGLIHRDIKPSNILVDDEGFVKIVDFGIAKSLEQDLHLTQTGQILGTPYFMAPEALKGARPDIRSDMYALGLTLYAAFTGKYPYEVKTTAELALRLETGPVPDPRLLRPELPGPVAALIRRLMAVDPAERYQDYDRLIGEIEECRTVSPVVLVELPSWRRRGYLVLAAALLVGIAAVAILYSRRDTDFEKNEPLPSHAPGPISPGPESGGAVKESGTAPRPEDAPASAPEPSASPQSRLSEPRLSAPPQPAAPAATRTVVTDFSLTDGRSEWIPVPQKLPLGPGRDRFWAWEAGHLLTTTHSQYLFKYRLVGDAEVIVDLQFLDQEPRAAFGIRVFGQRIADRGYLVGYTPDAARVTREGEQQTKPLIETPVAWVAGRHRLAISVRGQEIAVARDGERLASAVHAGPREGDLLLRMMEGRAMLYRVEVTATRLEPMPVQPPRSLRPLLPGRGSQPAAPPEDGDV